LLIIIASFLQFAYPHLVEDLQGIKIKLYHGSFAIVKRGGKFFDFSPFLTGHPGHPWKRRFSNFQNSCKIHCFMLKTT